MPTVSVDRDALFARLGRTYTQDDFEKLCFDFGIELDDVAEEAVEAKDGEAATGETKTMYKIEVAANRYDLLCIEGLARSLRVFLELDAAPTYTSAPPASGEPLTMTVEADTALVRPYIVCAVLRGVTFTPESYASFIDLQDKLHQNICRHRRLVAIGTHDLATLSPPFRYRALPPGDIRFVPLAQDREWAAGELLEFYETDASVKHLKAFPAIIKDKPVYPAIYDSAGALLSLPPIINGEHSKITLTTRDVFIECTATDLTKANVVLNTMVTLFSEYAAAPFTAEQVRVEYETPEQCPSAPYLTPDLAPFPMRASIAEINGAASISIDAATAASLATRMGLDASADGDDAIVCRVPPTRSDILHECDVVEDVAIAYGYNNIVPRIPSTPTCAAALPANLLADKLRASLAQMGCWETLTTALVSRHEAFGAMRLPEDGSVVELSNPKSESFQVVRRSLIPSVLKCAATNRKLPLAHGLRFFEVSDVVLLDDSTDTGARNERRLCVCYAGLTAGFEVVQGIVERVMNLLEVPRRWASPASAVAAGAVPADAPKEAVDAVMNAWGRGGLAYRMEATEHPSFFPGRCAKMVLLRSGEGAAAGAAAASSAGTPSEEPLGMIGIVHPEVLGAFEVGLAASVVEISLEPFVDQ